MMDSPSVAALNAAIDALRAWQHEGAPMQLHPGDVGWFWRFGAEATAAAVRTWSRGGEIVAVGLLDGADLLRMTMAPAMFADEDLALRVSADLSTIFPTGRVAVEAPTGVVLHEVLGAEGWKVDEPWTPLYRDLSAPVEDPGVRIEVIRPDLVAERVAVHRASFGRSIFTEQSWHAMANGPAYADARCLVAYEGTTPVAAVTVWSAGVGKPGLLEPMGVHHDHRGHGYGRAITIAAAAALQRLGSSSAIVCTPSSNVGGVATYVSGGFVAQAEVHDRYRDG